MDGKARRCMPPHPCFQYLLMQCPVSPIMRSPLPDVQPSQVTHTYSPADIACKLSHASTAVLRS